MRTTLTLDDDLLIAVRQISASTGETLGEVVSRLARASISTPKETGTYRNGVKLVPANPGARGATLDEVNQLRDDLA